MKKAYLIIFAMVVGIFLSIGCATPALWKKGTKNTTNRDYNETISAFMINPNDKSMVFIGERYHYIFEPNSTLEYLITHKDSSIDFKIEDGGYRTEGNVVNAYFVATIDKTKATKATKEWLSTQRVKGEGDIFVDLTGKRYISDPKINAVAAKSSKIYRINIHETIRKTDIGGTVVKVLATPLALVADGFIIMGLGIAQIPMTLSNNK